MIVYTQLEPLILKKKSSQSKFTRLAALKINNCKFLPWPFDWVCGLTTTGPSTNRHLSADGAYHMFVSSLHIYRPLDWRNGPIMTIHLWVSFYGAILKTLCIKQRYLTSLKVDRCDCNHLRLCYREHGIKKKKKR